MEYEGYKLCPELKPKEYCLVVEQYEEGTFERLFHAHIPAHRISKNCRLEVLRTLVARYAPLWFEAIVATYVNAKPGEPAHENLLPMHVTYPERGVLRTYCGTNTKAWIDEVLVPTDFRGMP